VFYVKLYSHSLEINFSDSTKMHGATIRFIACVCYVVMFVTVPYLTNKQTTAFCEISGFGRGVIATFAFMRFYAA